MCFSYMAPYTSSAFFFFWLCRLLNLRVTPCLPNADASAQFRAWLNSLQCIRNRKDTFFFLESFELYHCSWNPTTGILLKITDYSKLRNEKKAKGKKPLRNQSFWIVLNFDFALHYRWEALDNTTTVAAVFTRGVQSAYKNSLLGSGAKTRLVFISALIITCYCLKWDC